MTFPCKIYNGVKECTKIAGFFVFFLPRYEDRLRNEDLAVQAAYEKRKESKKLSQIKTKQIKPMPNLQPTQEEAYDFFTKVDWGPEIVSAYISLKMKIKTYN